MIVNNPVTINNQQINIKVEKNEVQDDLEKTIRNLLKSFKIDDEKNFRNDFLFFIKEFKLEQGKEEEFFNLLDKYRRD